MDYYSLVNQKFDNHANVTESNLKDDFRALKSYYSVWFTNSLPTFKFLSLKPQKKKEKYKRFNIYWMPSFPVLSDYVVLCNRWFKVNQYIFRESNATIFNLPPYPRVVCSKSKGFFFSRIILSFNQRPSLDFFRQGKHKYRKNSKYWDTQTKYRSCP